MSCIVKNYHILLLLMPIRFTTSKLWKALGNTSKHLLVTGIFFSRTISYRHLQTCELLRMRIPDKIAVIGIDNEEVTRHLLRVSWAAVVRPGHRL